MNEAEREYRLAHLTEEQRAEMARMLKNGTIRTVEDYFEYLDSQIRVEESIQIDQQRIALEEQINKKLDNLRPDIADVLGRHLEENRKIETNLNEGTYEIVQAVAGIIKRMFNEKIVHCRLDFYLTQSGEIVYRIGLDDETEKESK